MNRKSVSQTIEGTNIILIEDDPYGELRYRGKSRSSFLKLLPDNTIQLGSFSKTIVPGFRLGWVVAPDHIMKKLLVAKQAADLHTSHFTQSIIYQYLKDNDIDRHIEKIKNSYGDQCRVMIESIQKDFPEEVKCTNPEGGMFLWAELPDKMAALDLFDIAVKDKVVFVPGDPFYINKKRTSTLRLNFSCVDKETIRTGIKRLGNAILKLQ